MVSRDLSDVTIDCLIRRPKLSCAALSDRRVKGGTDTRFTLNKSSPFPLMCLVSWEAGMSCMMYVYRHV